MRLLSTRIHYQHRDDGTSTEMWTHQAVATSASAEAAATTTGAVVADSRIFSETFDATSEAALAAAATGAVDDAVVVLSLSAGGLCEAFAFFLLAAHNLFFAKSACSVLHFCSTTMLPSSLYSIP